jgi:branched-chain amino acid transport system permease protein
MRRLASPSSLVVAGAFAGLALWPLAFPDAFLYQRVFALACLYAALAFSWNIYALTGAISLGHAAFFGLGAYGSALANEYWSLSPWLSIVLGGILGTGYGLCWTFAFQRLRGPYFALATLASVEIPKVIIDNWEGFTHGSLGMVGIEVFPSLKLGSWEMAFGESLKAQYYLLFVVMVVTAGLHGLVMKSRWGWALRAVREDEVAASSLGVSIFGTRLGALSLSAFLTGICGALYAHLIGLIEPAIVFSLHISALPLVLSIFGGRYQPFGPLLGALILYPADQLLFHSWLPAGHAALYGLVIVATILCFPQGIAAWTQERARSAWNAGG